MSIPATTAPRVTLDDLYGEETANWMRLTPRQRWAETSRLAVWFHALGGTSDPDPDPSSPFYDPAVRRARPVDGGQACVLYGAAEYSRDLDLAVLATDAALPRLRDAMQSLHATVIAVPPLEQQFLARGHAVHFSVPDDTSVPLRVDIMSRMRGVAPFEELWVRRTTVTLPDHAHGGDVTVELMALEDLVTAKKTQRDKDWPISPRGRAFNPTRRRGSRIQWRCRERSRHRTSAGDGARSRVLGTAPARTGNAATRGATRPVSLRVREVSHCSRP